MIGATEGQDMFAFDEMAKNEAVIKVVGVGGGGGNALSTMINSGLKGVDFIAANTDLQALRNNPAETKIQLGANLTRGLGAGANPEVGRNAAMEDRERIAEMMGNPDMVFITAGMGGGTGTGAAPIIAEVAKAQGALTVGVVTKPFIFEGKRRQRQAEEGIHELHSTVDTLITIPNSRLLSVVEENTSMMDAFRKVDDVLLNAVRGISDLINVAGLINVDFADVKTIMANQGLALMGTGIGKGPDRAVEAAHMAIHSPLLDNIEIRGAMGILINITGGPDLGLHEVSRASTVVSDEAHEDANIIFGSVVHDDIGEEVRITVIATGFEPKEKRRGRGRDAGLTAEGVRPQDRDVPPLLRKQRHEVSSTPARPAPIVSSSLGSGIDDEPSALDIPTFLRRAAD